MWTRTDDPLTAPNTPQEITVRFEKGLPVKVSSEGKEWTDSLDLFSALNAIGKKHGIGNRCAFLIFSKSLIVTIGRIDIVENRFIG